MKLRVLLACVVISLLMWAALTAGVVSCAALLDAAIP